MKVSVIIPNYNRAGLIVETIRNMLAQTRPPAEVIVVDDGSTDGSVAAIRTFGNRVRLIQQENAGPGAARNRGLAAASGEYIQFMDSDDLASLNKLEAQSRRLDETGADVVFSPWAKVQIEAGRIYFEDHVLQQRLPRGKQPLARHLLRGWSTVLQSLLFRRTAVARAGRFQEDMFCLEDIDLLLRVSLAGAKISFEDSCLTFYRSAGPGKLTADGTTVARRASDRVKFIRRARANCGRAGFHLDFGTRLALQLGLHQALEDLGVGEVAAGPARTEAAGQLPVFSRPGLKLLNAGGRILAGVRGRLRGARWSPAYCSSPPKDWQAGLAAGVAAQLAASRRQFPEPVACLNESLM